MFRKTLALLPLLLASAAAQAQYAQDIEDQFKYGCSHDDDGTIPRFILDGRRPQRGAGPR